MYWTKFMNKHIMLLIGKLNCFVKGVQASVLTYLYYQVCRSRVGYNPLFEFGIVVTFTLNYAQYTVSAELKNR